jgi:hypothetical protein
VDNTYSVGSVRWSQPQSLDKCERVQNPDLISESCLCLQRKNNSQNFYGLKTLSEHCELTDEAEYVPLPFSVFSKVFSKICYKDKIQMHAMYQYDWKLCLMTIKLCTGLLT